MARKHRAPDADAPPAAQATGRGPLGLLADELAARAATRDAAAAVPYPELGLLDPFRALWSRVRTESQMRETLAYTAEDAGPLNSSALVHRSIALMRDASPAYLQHFLTYVDALSWMERLETGSRGGPKDPMQPATIGKRARAKPRARK